MNCREVDRLLSFVDAEARVERETLQLHFRECARCRNRHPEVPALLVALQAVPDRGSAARPPRRRTVPIVAAAAAMLLLATAGFLAIVTRTADVPVRSGKARTLGQAVSMVRHRTLRIEPDQVVSYTTTRGNVRPDPFPETEWRRIP